MCEEHSPSAVQLSVDKQSVLARALERAVLFYQNYISPLKMGSTCRFEPTCSAYALDALRQRGAVVGTVLTFARLAKCGPWHPGGYDPVPSARGCAIARS